MNTPKYRIVRDNNPTLAFQYSVYEGKKLIKLFAHECEANDYCQRLVEDDNWNAMNH